MRNLSNSKNSKPKFTSYKQLCRDVRDSQHENVKEKEELIESLRHQERELDFLKQIVSVVMSKDELEEVRNHAQWDEEKEDWVVPNFEFYDRGAPPPRSSNQKSSYEVRVDRSAAAVSPQPRDSPERSSKQFRVKHSGANASKEHSAFRAPSNTKLERLNFDSDIFDGRMRSPRWSWSILQLENKGHDQLLNTTTS